MSRYTFTLPDSTSPLTGLDCRVPATVRPDWRMPDPPPGGDWHACVEWTGDGWLAGWVDDNGDGPEQPYIVGEDGWPFVEDAATSDDWEAAGFEVV